MARTPKPLNVLVHPTLADWPDFQQLSSQGHWVTTSLVSREGSPASLADFDVVFGPTAWRMDDKLRGYLPVAIKAARAARYPKEKPE